MKEKDLQLQILELLHAAGIWAFQTHKVGAFRHLPIKKGISDILGIKNTGGSCPSGRVGRFLAIEVKLPGKIPNPRKRALTDTERAEIQFIDEVNLAGGLAFFADSIELVKERLNLSHIHL